MKKTLFEKIWEKHVVCEEPGEQPLLYIDLHLVHEVTSPQAFEGLRLAGRKLRRPDRTFANPACRRGCIPILNACWRIVAASALLVTR